MLPEHRTEEHLKQQEKLAKDTSKYINRPQPSISQRIQAFFQPMVDAFKKMFSKKVEVQPNGREDEGEEGSFVQSPGSSPNASFEQCQRSKSVNISIQRKTENSVLNDSVSDLKNQVGPSLNNKPKG